MRLTRCIFLPRCTDEVIGFVRKETLVPEAELSLVEGALVDDQVAIGDISCTVAFVIL